jgi:HlyD family secretion protein
MSRNRKLGLGIVILAAAGAGGWAAYTRGPKPTIVETAKVERADVQSKVTANGKIQAKKKVDISATIAGQITQLAVKEGDKVAKGQLLLQIDAVNPRANARSTEFSMQALLRDVESAQANLGQARTDLARAENNFRAQIIPEADVERARTAVATAEAGAQAAQRRVDEARARLEGAQDTLAKTTVRSPIDGIVTAKRVEEGEVAVIGVQNQPGTVLLTISDMSVVEAEMEVDETAIPQVQVGQEARVRIDAYPNQTFPAVVTEVGSSPILRQGGATPNEAIKFEVKVQLKTPPENVKPGLSVQADILTGFRPQAVVVPIQALVVRDIERKPGEQPKPGEPRDEEGVYLMDGGKAKFQPIKTGLMGEMTLEVTKGLAGGETIISGPFRALRTMKPGEAVKVEEKKDKDKGPGPQAG